MNPRSIPAILVLMPLAINAATAQNQTELEIQRPDDVPIVVPIDEQAPLTIDPETGNISLLAETGFTCGSGCDNVQVSMTDADGGQFLVNGDITVQVPENQSVAFQWASRGAFSCTGTGELVGTEWNTQMRVPIGSANVGLQGLPPGTYLASIECSNGPALDARGPVTIEILPSELEIPPGCEGRQPGNATATASCIFGDDTVNCFAYQEVFGDSFPGRFRGREIETSANTYMAMKFSTAGLTATSGGWSFQTPQFGSRNTGAKQMSISTCPGDFDADAVAADMGSSQCIAKTSGITPSVRWKQAGESGFGCPLEPNREYWLNLIYTSDPVSNDSADVQYDCGGDPESSCSNLVNASFSQ
mgnify:CR=1 FL=1